MLDNLLARVSRRTIAIAAAALCALCASDAAAQCQYEVTIIEGPGCPPWGVPTPLVGTGMNELGHVTGHYQNCDTSTDDNGFFWTPETGLVTMHKPPGVLRVRPADINENGLIVGHMLSDAGQRGFVYDMHTQEYSALLEPLHGVGGSSLSAINNAGIAVGSRSIGKPGQSPNPFNAVIWDTNTGEVIDLGILSGPNSGATDITESGEFIAGWTGSSPPVSEGVIWSNGVPQLIGHLPGTDGNSVNSINKYGVGVGGAMNINTFWWRAFLWNGSVTIIDATGDWHHARGQEINDLGQAFVLFTKPSQNHVPILWQHGELHHLNLLLVDSSPDVHLTGTAATNNHGEVLCSAGTRAVLLAPVNRPLTDLNADCVTDVHDLLMLLDAWGYVPRGSTATADFNGDGIVDVSDLLILLTNWTPERR